MSFSNFLGDMSGVALITGAGSGMGRATAFKFAEAGAKLILVDINEAGLKETQKLIGPNVKALKLVVLNICNDQEVIDMVRAIPNDPEFGRIDYALNCAGVLGKVRGPFADSEATDNDFIMNVNVRAQGIMVQEELKVMLAQSPRPSVEGQPPRPLGSIVNWCSWVTFHGSKTSWAYAASKHALAAMTKSAAVAHGAQGIRCNAVCPGVMNTPLLNAETMARMVALVPSQRPGEADEVANLALFLSSDTSSYINGALVSIDGGWNAC